MPAQIVVVMEEPGIAEAIVAGLRSLGLDAIALPDSLAAWNAFDAPGTAEVLIGSIRQRTGLPNGIALARTAKMHRPGMKAIFVGDYLMARHTAGVGILVASDASAADIVSRTIEVLDY